VLPELVGIVFLFPAIAANTNDVHRTMEQM
jgi:hypothetical protein